MLSLQVLPEYVVPGLTILLEAAEPPPNFASAERLLRNILSAIVAVGCALSAAFSYLDVLRWNRREQGIYGLSPPALMTALVHSTSALINLLWSVFFSPTYDGAL